MPNDHTIDVPAARFVLVHYRIFKNGGTTIESILQREFGAAFATIHGPAADSVLDADSLIRFLRRRPEISAVSSHHFRYPKPAVADWIIFDCCFLRHPLDRLVSLYNHFRRTDSLDPLAVMARRKSPAEFMKQLLRESPNFVNDVQVTQLANGGAFTRPASERDLERATQIFRDMALPGIVEMFDESLIAAEYFLRPAFPGLRLHHIPQNVNRPTRVAGRAELDTRIEPRPDIERALVELLGGDVYEDLLRLNRFDIELFRQAQIENQRRLSLLPDLRQRIVEFRAREALDRTRLSEREQVLVKVATGAAR